MHNHTSVNLTNAAEEEMKLQGFELTPFPGHQKQLADILAGTVKDHRKRTDLRGLAWSSIDNDTSRDLDQIEWAERLEDGGIRVRVGVADVTATIGKDTPIDKFAARQCATIYTAARNFPMLPIELATGFTSLTPGGARHADGGGM